MNSKKSVFIVVLIIILIGLGVYAFSSSPDKKDVMEKTETATTQESNKTIDNGGETNMEKNDSAMVKKSGSYETYSPDKIAMAESGKVVLFFRASWCPSCRALDASIRSNLTSIPEGVTILDVDYDNSTALKQKYGVTYQHTLVQVDASGNQIVKWSGSPTLVSLVTNIK